MYSNASIAESVYRMKNSIAEFLSRYNRMMKVRVMTNCGVYMTRGDLEKLNAIYGIHVEEV